MLNQCFGKNVMLVGNSQSAISFVTSGKSCWNDYLVAKTFTPFLYFFLIQAVLKCDEQLTLAGLTWAQFLPVLEESLWRPMWKTC